MRLRFIRREGSRVVGRASRLPPRAYRPRVWRVGPHAPLAGEKPAPLTKPRNSLKNIPAKGVSIKQPSLHRPELLGEAAPLWFTGIMLRGCTTTCGLNKTAL